MRPLLLICSLHQTELVAAPFIPLDLKAGRCWQMGLQQRPNAGVFANKKFDQARRDHKPDAAREEEEKASTESLLKNTDWLLACGPTRFVRLWPDHELHQRVQNAAVLLLDGVAMG